MSVRLLSLALLLGALGDLLFKGQPLGLNALLWIAALALAWRAVATISNQAEGQGRWLLVAVGFASCLAVRDADYLAALNICATAAALGLAALPLHVANPRRARVRDIAFSLGWTLAMLFAGPVMLAGEADWSRFQRRGRLTSALAGLALATPVVLVFGALFASADPTFAELARIPEQLDLDAVTGHAVVAFFIAWIAAGLLRAWVYRRATPTPADARGPLLAVTNATPIAIAVGAMVLIFLLFVAIQARYLFGGAALVQTMTGLTYAEYARQGFFQMVTASGLAIPILYGADVLLVEAPASARANLRRLGTVQLCLVALVMLSALARMRLYVSVYGLTQDRVVATAILLWLGIVTAWFAATVLRGRRERFAWGALVTGFAVLAGLNAVNPDKLIVRTNLARAVEGTRPLDRAYLGTISADGLPWLGRHLDEVPAAQRDEVTLTVQDRLKMVRLADRDWRSWNLSRANATH